MFVYQWTREPLWGEAVEAAEAVVFPEQGPHDQAPSTMGLSHLGCIRTAGSREPHYSWPLCAASPHIDQTQVSLQVPLGHRQLQ